jgi:hypothetical protein
VALVVYRLSIANLGLGKLSEEVEERFGAREAMRWRRARTREYVTRLRDQLRLHLSNTELIIHADEADADDRMQVIATLPSGDVDEIGRLEREISDRVEAISKRTWIAWSEGLRVTMSMLEELEGAA